MIPRFDAQGNRRIAKRYNIIIGEVEIYIVEVEGCR